MKSRVSSIVLLFVLAFGLTANGADYKKEIYVNQNGTADYATVAEALEGVRAFMDYQVTIHIAPGVYKEKLIIPSWLENVTFVGENADSTVITFDHHANIDNMGTFRTYTVRVDGNNLTFKNLTIENNAPQLGQAVALHTEGDRLHFVNCRFLGNQDTIFTGGKNKRLLFDGCYIEGTTDFIFGPATAMFRDCDILCKRDSYITAASTPADVKYGYVFSSCRIKALPEVTKMYLGRPWRPYAHTVFINCEMNFPLRAARWHNWNNADNEKTARYGEYGTTGTAASMEGCVPWARTLTEEEVADCLDIAKVFEVTTTWTPEK